MNSFNEKALELLGKLGFADPNMKAVVSEALKESYLAGMKRAAEMADDKLKKSGSVDYAAGVRNTMHAINREITEIEGDG